MELAKTKADVLQKLAPAGAVELVITPEETRQLVDLPEELQGTTIDDLLAAEEAFAEDDEN